MDDAVMEQKFRNSSTREHALMIQIYDEHAITNMQWRATDRSFDECKFHSQRNIEQPLHHL